jgi:hypothetical protein
LQPGRESAFAKKTVACLFDGIIVFVHAPYFNRAIQRVFSGNFTRSHRLPLLDGFFPLFDGFVPLFDLFFRSIFFVFFVGRGFPVAIKSVFYCALASE